MVSEPRYSSNGRIIKPHDEKTFAKDWQKEILLEYFEQNPYPTKEVCLELEEKIELDSKWIKNWYQYQRKRRNITQDKVSSTIKLIIEGEPEMEPFQPPSAKDLPEDKASSKKLIKTKVVSQPWQREILLDYFSRNPYPNKEEVAEIEAKIELNTGWIKSWFHTKRQREKNNPNSNIKITKVATEKVTLSEDTGTDESFEKVTETTAAAPDIKIEVYEELRRRFEDLQTQYKVLAELLLQRSLTTEQTRRTVDPPKVPTVDLTGSSSDPAPEVSMPGETHRQYPGMAYPGPGYTFPPYYPHYYPPQYPAYPPPSYYPQPQAQPPPSSLPYPPAPQ